MRILITENDLASRVTLEKLLSVYGECQAVNEVSHAIQCFIDALKYTPRYDAVIIDIDIKDGNPISLIKKLRSLEERARLEHKERAKIFVITSTASKNRILQCVQAGCNSLILRPFTKETVLKKFAEAGVNLHATAEKGSVQLKLYDIAEQLYLKFQKGQLSLPSQPQTATKFREQRKNGASLKEIEQTLKHDISISATIIQVSNSVIFAGSTRCRTVAEAMQRIGLDETEHYVNAIINKRLYENLPRHLSEIADQLWRHSLACSFYCEHINKLLSSSMQFDPFTLGLMHDIGKLLLLQMFSEIARQKKDMKLLKSKEFYELLSSDMHEKFGAALLQKWEFPYGFYQTVLHHERPENSTSVKKDLAILHTADQLAKSIGYKMHYQKLVKVDREFIDQHLNISYETLEELKPEVDKKVKAAANMI